MTEKSNKDDSGVSLGRGIPVEGAPVARILSRLHWPIAKSEVSNKEGEEIIRTPTGPHQLDMILEEVDESYFESQQELADAIFDVIGRGPIPAATTDGGSEQINEPATSLSFITLAHLFSEFLDDDDDSDPTPKEKAVQRFSEDVRDTFDRALSRENTASDKAFKLIQVSGIILGLLVAFGNQHYQMFSNELGATILFSFGILLLILSIYVSLRSFLEEPRLIGVDPDAYRSIKKKHGAPTETVYLYWISVKGYKIWLENIREVTRIKRRRISVAIYLLMGGLSLVLLAIIIVSVRVAM